MGRKIILTLIALSIVPYFMLFSFFVALEKEDIKILGSSSGDTSFASIIGGFDVEIGVGDSIRVDVKRYSRLEEFSIYLHSIFLFFILIAFIMTYLFYEEEEKDLNTHNPTSYYESENTYNN